MKTIYFVYPASYNTKPCLAFESKEEALKVANAISSDGEKLIEEILYIQSEETVKNQAREYTVNDILSAGLRGYKEALSDLSKSMSDSTEENEKDTDNE